MPKRKILYGLIACVCILFILYSLANNFILDPGREDFLSHKSGLEREPKLPAWLNVMYVHVAFACLAMATGLINFSNRIFQKHRKFHRVNGYAYLLSVLIVILTSGYMAPYATGGKLSSMGFNVLNLAWLFVSITALVHIKKKRIVRHRQWMMRSYAFCFNNMLIHLVTFVFHDGFGFAYATSYTIGVYGSIALIFAVPSLLIRRIDRSAIDPGLPAS